MLENIKSPEDIKALDTAQLYALANEVRQKIITTVSHTGGHLASNLGAVEITLALHRELDCPEDKLIFDVGHQAYTHKLLTGRYERFGTLRQQGGISGFPRRSESEYDAFSVGHASTAISAALGMARARDIQGRHYRVVAVVGDGALTGGMCYEALNDLGASGTHMTIILNDNEMSIARNVGALSCYLTRLRNSPLYHATKAHVRLRLSRLKHIGPPLMHMIERIKNALKFMLVRGSFFEIFGLEYVGPVDGHDINALRAAIRHADKAERPVMLHVITRKGHGYAPAENSPERFHGTAPFFIETGAAQSAGAALNSSVMAEKLVDIMRRNALVTGITAAMPSGTGMDIVARHCPNRVLDVGIAEEHALTMAAGMAAAGARPFVCLYSTFMQRAFDQLIHDVALDALPVCLLIDRAGAAGADGATHQGVFDIAFMNMVPDMRIMSPRCAEELKLMMDFALTLNAPCAIRYARDADANLCGGVAPIEDGRWEDVTPQALDGGPDVTMLAVGCMVNTALQAARRMAQAGFGARVINARFVRPLDRAMLDGISGAVVTLEDGIIKGGFGEAVKLEFMRAEEYAGHARTRVLCLGYPDEFIEHASRQAILAQYGLDCGGVTRSVTEWIKKWR